MAMDSTGECNAILKSLSVEVTDSLSWQGMTQFFGAYTKVSYNETLSTPMRFSHYSAITIYRNLHSKKRVSFFISKNFQIKFGMAPSGCAFSEP